jgi:eukaryotic-like serine/threonine-protein kinase
MTLESERGPIHDLVSRRTDDGWEVLELVVPKSYQTGGFFSVGYLARHDNGRMGFFKALDFRRALDADDPTHELEKMLNTYNFERGVLSYCERLSKVVLAISSGSLSVPGAPLDKVFYLIFELADGDVRKFAQKQQEYEIIWVLRALHHIAVGLSQLHGVGISHQDLKPSNVLVFQQGRTSKVADLGRAHCTSIPSPHDDFLRPGAANYSPPEQLYGYEMEDREKGRAAADLYLLGSMIYFFFMGTMFTPALIQRLRDEHRPMASARGDRGWRGFYADVLPFVRDAIGLVLADFNTHVVTTFSRVGRRKEGEELCDLLSYLVGPNPAERGHPLERRAKHSNQFALGRFISALNRIALRCESELKRTNATTAREHREEGGAEMA